MSRCFPYPSLGYMVPGVRGEASIESIKIQRDGISSKTEQKKREKKDRKKEKKDDEVKSVLKLKKLENTIEPLEKSDLTEEHGPPCYLSDGSQSSGKRKREETQSNPAPRVLKIRINPPKKPEQLATPAKKPEQLATPAKKPEQPSISVKKPEQPSISVKKPEQPVISGKKPEQPIITVKKPQQPVISVKKPEQPIITVKKRELPVVSAFKRPESSTALLVRHTDNARDSNVRESCSSLPQEPSIPECSNRREQITAPCVASTSSSSYDKKSKKLKKEALKHKQLIEDWVPPTLSQFVLDTVDDDDDQDWLFGTKHSDQPAVKRARTDAASAYNAPEKADLWPHSCFLAEAGIHALPYTVPF